jgi:hypothetical protein
MISKVVSSQSVFFRAIRKPPLLLLFAARSFPREVPVTLTLSLRFVPAGVLILLADRNGNPQLTPSVTDSTLDIDSYRFLTRSHWLLRDIIQ